MSQQTGFTTKLAEIISNPQLHSKEYIRFGKFAVVGLIGAVVDFALFNIMLYLLRDVWQIQISWQLFGLDVNWVLLMANTVSVSAAIISNFTWNRLWTFPESRARKKRKQLVQFTTVNVVGLLLNNIILLIAYAFIAPYVESALLSDNLAKAAAIGIVLFWNFGANRLWTYRGL
ncbi:GtrA family protein [Anaerolineales bacterium HSG6]|nr:GtrA family protein [Anaerolineales bacterium HSG6]MDM8529808.1 GtrA family protein [Anaerolineales bacterium HSG25]